MTKTPMLVLVPVGLLMSAALFAQPTRLATPSVGDLVPSRLLPAGPVPGLEVPREAVRYSWPLDPRTPLTDGVEPIVTESRSYTRVVDASSLVEGVALETTAVGAVVRVHPFGAPADRVDGLAIRPERLVITTVEGRRLADGAAMETLADAAALETAGVPFAAGTSAFRLHADLPVGRVTLAAPDLTSPAGTRYQISVFEPASSVVLRLGADRADVHAGDEVRFEARLVDEDRPTRARVEGFVSSPDGRTWPLRFEALDDGGHGAVWTTPAVSVRGEGLWQVHTMVEGLTGVRSVVREGRAPFAVAVPTARLKGDVTVLQADRGLSARLGVVVESAGRFEARAVLWGTDVDGRRRPMAAASVADWIEAGDGELVLAFDADTIAGSSLEPPYELRDLRLVDQGRMGVLHRQAFALVVE